MLTEQVKAFIKEEITTQLNDRLKSLTPELDQHLLKVLNQSAPVFLSDEPSKPERQDLQE